MKEFRSPLNYMWQNMSQRVFDFIRGSRKHVTLPVPASLGDTVTLYVSAPETIVKFDGDLTQAFNLNTVPVNAKLGDKMYLIFSSATDGYEITSTGSLDFNSCGPGSLPSAHNVEVGTTIIPFLFDGTKFYGLDYC
jgi:hypothetical protein